MSPFMQQSESAWEDDGGALRPPSAQHSGSDRLNRNQTSGATPRKANDKPLLAEERTSPLKSPNLSSNAHKG